MRSTVLAVLLGVFIGCGGGGGNNDVPDSSPPGDGNTTPDAPPIPEGFTRLIGRTWTIPAGKEIYRCVRITLTEDTYLTNIRAQAPAGTHHTVLSITQPGDNANGADGEQNCQVNSLGRVMLYASGVGTEPLDFPTDVGIKIAAGQQIHLNLHLFNATDSAIEGDSAILVKQSATPPPTLAEMVFAGKFVFSIPGNGQPTNVVGGCTANSNFKLFAVWPHMHQIATHQKFELIRGGNTMVLHDKPFQFAEQNYYLQSPEVSVQSGDQIRVTCTFVNNTGSPIGFGDSSNKEMCFSGMYRYPATASNLFQCTDTGGFGF
ncbi:MAG: hypothetical protein KF773_37025 [Deltaproteobacteria bacterium]|nr:hypothetical protein [Deltaproteobacteria bacterium]